MESLQSMQREETEAEEETVVAVEVASLVLLEWMLAGIIMEVMEDQAVMVETEETAPVDQGEVMVVLFRSSLLRLIWIFFISWLLF